MLSPEASSGGLSASELQEHLEHEFEAFLDRQIPGL
jgi:hypothetical protein